MVGNEARGKLQDGFTHCNTIQNLGLWPLSSLGRNMVSCLIVSSSCNSLSPVQRPLHCRQVCSHQQASTHTQVTGKHTAPADLDLLSRMFWVGQITGCMRASASAEAQACCNIICLASCAQGRPQGMPHAKAAAHTCRFSSQLRAACT